MSSATLSADNYNRRLASPAGAEAGRLQEIAQALHPAEARRVHLQQPLAGAVV